MSWNQDRSDGQNQKKNAITETWSVIYPIFLYFAVCQIMNMFVPVLPELDAVKRQALNTAVAGTVIYVTFVRKEKKKIFVTSISGLTVIGACLAVLLLGCAGLAVNNVIALTHLRDISDSYQTVEQAFYSSGMGWELFALGIVAPIAEELLYRYIVFYHLRGWQGRTAAIIGSAFIFGLLHMNIVQAVYAFVLGLLLGILMEYYQDVRVPILGHITANILAIIRGETEFLSWLRSGNELFVPVTVGLLVAVVVIAGWHVKSFKKN